MKGWQEYRVTCSGAEVNLSIARLNVQALIETVMINTEQLKKPVIADRGKKGRTRTFTSPREVNIDDKT